MRPTRPTRPPAATARRSRRWSRGSGMDRVVAIRRRRVGDPTVEVELASGEKLRVHDRRILEHRLAAGAEPGPPAVDALRRAAGEDAAERRALRLIARRPRSQAELRARMME